MLAKDVLRVLGITRPTLTKYVKTGIIRVNVLPNKRYDYNEDDVYGFLNKDMKRKTFQRLHHIRHILRHSQRNQF